MDYGPYSFAIRTDVRCCQLTVGVGSRKRCMPVWDGASVSIAVQHTITRELAIEYGPLLDAAATAKALGFKSQDALRQARRDGRLPISMFRLPGRRGWFASTQAVIEWIDAQVEPHLPRNNPAGGLL